jgi:hypothetical protein
VRATGKQIFKHDRLGKVGGVMKVSICALGRATSIAILFVFTSCQYARAQTSALSKSDCGSPPNQFAESETADTTLEADLAASSGKAQQMGIIRRP